MELDKAIYLSDLKGKNVIKSIVGQDNAIATCKIDSVRCILKKLCNGSEGKHEQERVA